MKCPKCHYLSFEPEARCRNCGYDLALADADLAMFEFDSENADAPAADSAAPSGRRGTGAGGRGTALARCGIAGARRAEPSRGTVLDLPARPRAPRRPRPVSTEPRPTRTAAAAARMAALDAPVAAPEPGGRIDDLPALGSIEFEPEPVNLDRTSAIPEHDFSEASREASPEVHVVAGDRETTFAGRRWPSRRPRFAVPARAGARRAAGRAARSASVRSRPSRRAPSCHAPPTVRRACPRPSCRCSSRGWTRRR